MEKGPGDLTIDLLATKSPGFVEHRLLVTSQKEVLTTCEVMQAIKQTAYRLIVVCLIDCITPQVISKSFQFITSNLCSTKSEDFITSKFYGKVPRPFFLPPQRKKWSGYAKLLSRDLQGKLWLPQFHTFSNYLKTGFCLKHQLKWS